MKRAREEEKEESVALVCQLLQPNHIITERIFRYVIDPFYYYLRLLLVCKHFHHVFRILLAKHHTWVYTPWCVAQYFTTLNSYPRCLDNDLLSVRLVGNIGLAKSLPNTVRHLQVIMSTHHASTELAGTLPGDIRSLMFIDGERESMHPVLYLQPWIKDVPNLERLVIRSQGRRILDKDNMTWMPVETLRVLHIQWYSNNIRNSSHDLLHVDCLENLRELVCKPCDTLTLPLPATTGVIRTPTRFPPLLTRLELCFAAEAAIDWNVFFNILPHDSLETLMLAASRIETFHFSKFKRLSTICLIAEELMVLSSSFSASVCALRLSVHQSTSEMRVTIPEHQLFANAAPHVDEIYIDGWFNHPIPVEDMPNLRVFDLSEVSTNFTHALNFPEDSRIEKLYFPKRFDGPMRTKYFPRLREVQMPKHGDGVSIECSPYVRQISTRKSQLVIKPI
jgi:hypothetical protein